jgi:hypothetical protein
MSLDAIQTPNQYRDAAGFLSIFRHCTVDTVPFEERSISEHLLMKLHINHPNFPSLGMMINDW